jgi:hypothetical protein
MNDLVVFGRRIARRRADTLVAALVAVVAVWSLLVASRALGPSFAELARLSAIERAEALILKIASNGVGSLTALELRALSPDAGAPPALALLFGAWAKLSIGRLGLLDPLTAARLPWLIPSALAPLFVYLIVRPSRGPLAAVLAAMFLLFFPRWLQAAGIGATAAALSGTWLLTIALYLRAAAPRATGSLRRRYCWAFAAAVSLGVSAALSLATLWLVLILILHHWVTNRGAVRRLVRRGRVPIPSTLVIAAPIAPLVFFLCRPELVSSNVTATAGAVLAVLAPSAEVLTFLGRTTAAGSPPVLAYSLAWLLWTLPSVIVAAAIAGLAAIVHRALARRFASGRLRPLRDRTGLGALVVLGGAATVVGPALAPSPLLVFPPRFELALPFVAIPAALGVEAAGRLAAGARLSWLPAAVTVAAVAWQTLRAPATLAASYAPLFGGAGEVIRSKVFSVGDGSELGALAAALDRLPASPIGLHAPDVPEAVWQELKRYGRLKATIVRTADPSGLRLERGAAQAGRPLAVVVRDRAPLWTLVE